MKRNVCETRVLALDVRLQRFGFAVLEGSNHLLEWGVRTYPVTSTNNLAKTVAKRISPLLCLFMPSRLIIKRAPGIPGPKRSRGTIILQTITDEARRRSITCAFVEREEIRRAF